MYRTLSACTVVLLSWNGPAAGQVLGELRRYDLRHFGPREGLPIAEVRDVAQPADGLIYAATARGVVRYDGIRFEPVPLDGFRSNVVNDLFADAMGRLWVLSGGLEVGLLEGLRVRRIHSLEASRGDLPSTSQGNRMTEASFSETVDGRVWMGSPGGLYAVTPRGVEHVGRDDGLPSDSVLGVFSIPGAGTAAVTARGAVWLTTGPSNGDGPSITVGDTLARYALWRPQRRHVRADPEGVWVRSHPDTVLRLGREGVTRHDLTRERVSLDSMAWDGRSRSLLTLATDEVSAALGGAALPRESTARLWQGLRSRDGARWISALLGSDVLLLRQSPDGGFQAPLSPVALRGALSFLEDHEGNLWIGTSDGLVQVIPRTVTALPEEHPLADAFTTALLEDTGGALWVGTWGRGVFRLTETGVDSLTTASGLPDDRIRALHLSPDGTLWVGTHGGPARLQAGQVEPVGPHIGEVRSFARDPSGVLWIASETHLIAYDGVSWHEPHPGAWRDRRIWALLHDPGAGLLVGTEEGLFRVRGGSIQALDEDDGLRDRFVTMLHRGSSGGDIWVGTYEGGLHRLRGDRAVPVPGLGNVAGDGVWTFLEDGMGGVWFSGDAGVVRLDRAAVLAATDGAADSAQSIAPVRFAGGAGRLTPESNRGSPASVRLRDGRLVFNNQQGLAVIDPDQALASITPPRLRLREITADGLALPVADSMVTPPRGVRHLTFELAPLTFAGGGSVRYRYRLEGYDNEWEEAWETARASYTNLPPGRYVFRVQGSRLPGRWDGVEAGYRLSIPPRFWQTWWFPPAVFLLLAAALAAAYRARVRHLLELERVRLRIARDLHDEVGSNLSSIALLGSRIRDRPGVDPRTGQQIGRMSQAAAETLTALRDVIWFVDPRHDDLGSLSRRMRKVAAELLDEVELEFADLWAGELRVGPGVLRQLFLVFKECIHNVSRHADARSVSISLSSTDGWIRLEVCDDGRGFDSGSAPRGYGLETMRMRTEDLGGELMIESQPGGGTCVVVRVPMA